MNRHLWALLVAFVLAAPWAHAGGPFSVKQIAAPGLQTARMSKQLAELCNEHLAQALHDRGLKVISQAQIGAILGLERQKQLLGCSDSTSCVLELTNALGADALVVGSVGLVGESFQVDVKITSSRDGSTLASSSGRVQGEEALLDELGRAADAIALKLTVAPKAEGGGGGKTGAIVAGVAALLFAGGGAFLGLQAQNNATIVRQEAPGGDRGAFTTAQTALKWQAPAADGLFGASVIAAGAAIVLAVTSSSSSAAPAVAVVPGPGSGVVVLGGSF